MSMLLKTVTKQNELISSLQHELECANNFKQECIEALTKAQEILSHCKADPGYSKEQYRVAVLLYTTLLKADKVKTPESNEVFSRDEWITLASEVFHENGGAVNDVSFGAIYDAGLAKVVV